ncbi:DUF3307 domain-containing protein [Rufibacter sp. XAAS-G3-1]|uniref:DUF3307 domain-containing protein n=1 Tax=Rufibacter sp. XAAS-G3-1 TaxID=2729134 RepID=UPI0015E70732|nr:DUF3307 domain-containing protein [Rufibacter sp. XAAS-G3-1]
MTGFTQIDILLLLKLILAHCISDFALQPSSWVEDRHINKHKSKFLYYHTLVTGLTALVLTLNWKLALIVTISHFFIDVWKSYRSRAIQNFLLDQLFHLIVIGLSWLYILGGVLNHQVILSNYTYMIYVTGYFIATYPLSILIKVCTSKWGIENNRTTANTSTTINQVQQPSQNLIGQLQEEERWDELKEAGRWIGIIERMLIITFVLLEQYEAIGLLIAGKSIIRFKESDQRKSEYFLFGTLLSISLSIFLALAMKVALQHK